MQPRVHDKKFTHFGRIWYVEQRIVGMHKQARMHTRSSVFHKMIDQINIAARYGHIDTRPQIRPGWTEFAHELISPQLALHRVKHGGR